ncbi:MAG: hypothetical protein ACRDVC_07020 [Acidimicrobiales bacterium]
MTKTDTGFVATDVWESQEAFGKFAEERVGPLTQKAGFPNPPSVKFFEVHNYLTGW